MTVSMLVLSLIVKSAAFADGQAIPKAFTCDGKDGAPRLEIKLLRPASSVALIVDDPDAPGGTFVHWVIWNLPTTDYFPSSVNIGPDWPRDGEFPTGVRQGKNDFGKLGWNGPCPPPGKPHHYRFRAFALDGKLALAPGASAAELEHAVQGHVLAQGTLTGTYRR